jgi:hypothetical protein
MEALKDSPFREMGEGELVGAVAEMTDEANGALERLYNAPGSYAPDGLAVVGKLLTVAYYAAQLGGEHQSTRVCHAALEHALSILHGRRGPSGPLPELVVYGGW